MGYPAEKLPDIGDWIRLLKLHPAGTCDAPLVCDLSNFRLDDSIPSYVALSYTWGEASLNRTILCNGLDFRINTNLDLALRAIRLPDTPQYIWVDQICIQQSHTLEKNSQLPLIGVIYSRFASAVIAWLGPTDDYTSNLIQYADWLLDEPFVDGYDAAAAAAAAAVATGRSPLDLQNSASDLERGHQALFHLLNTRPWFGRAWVVQEAIAQKERLLLRIGPFVFPYRRLHKIVLATNAYLRALTGAPLRNKTHPLGWTQFLIGLSFCPSIETTYHGGGGKSHQCLHEVVQRFCSWRASDPRDKIYAFHALASDVERYPRPDYRLAAEQVFHQFSQTSMSISLIEVLSQLTFAALSEPMPGLPSWVTDWRYFEDRKKLSFFRNDFAFSAGGLATNEDHYSFDGKLLTLRGAIVANVVDAMDHCWDPANESLKSWIQSISSLVPQLPQSFDGFWDYNEVLLDINAIASLLVLDGKILDYSLTGAEAAHLLALTAQHFDGTLFKEFLLKGGHKSLSRDPGGGSCSFKSDTSIRDLRIAPSKFLQRNDIEDDKIDQESTGLGEYRNALFGVLAHHKVMITSRGAYGVCNWKTRKGDVIAAIKGARLLMILRPRIAEDGSKQYSVISEAYVRGKLMFDGNALKLGEVTDLVIC